MTRPRPLLVAAALVVVLAVAVAVLATMGPVLDQWTRQLTPPDAHSTLRDEAAPPSPDDWTTLVDLSGPWAFRIGDAMRWREGEADAGWDRVAVPAAWEDEGYHGYDGFAWYRTTFALDAKVADVVRAEPPFLLLGRIDDADEVWLNGALLGRGGRMPPSYVTAAYGFRTYRVPPGLLRADRPNVLAVRVYDAGLEGGILEGPVALAVPTPRNPEGVPLVADLTGDWQFSPGDARFWAEPELDDAQWDTLRVPGLWETQGYPELGGYAWYRKRVALGAEAARQDLVLVLGAVDDLDEAFVNGTLVGRTGDVEGRDIQGDEWQIERAYRVSAEALRPGENVVAVRVYDGLLDGGIHRGPVALMTPEAYAERRRRAARDDW